MTMMEKKIAARAATLAALQEVLTQLDAVQFGDASFAVLQEIDGQEIWTEISVKSKSYTATKVSPAFDPFEAAEVWKEETAMKEKAKADRAAEKARKAEARAKKAEEEKEEE